MKTIRTGITIETHEVLIIRASRGASGSQCQQCADQTWMVPVEEALLLAGGSAREIYRWVEAGSVHYMEMPGGFLLVCLNSIMGPVTSQAERHLKRTELESGI